MDGLPLEHLQRWDIDLGTGTAFRSAHAFRTALALAEVVLRPGGTAG
ncbi:hypothetical protein [Streptomyces sp. NPDC056948]